MGLGWHHRGHDRENRVLRPPVSVTPEPGRLSPGTTLFSHALRLHQQDPDGVLPRDGEPYPDDELHRRRQRPQAPKDRRLDGADVAAILDVHFGKAGASHEELADAFHGVDIPIHRNEHIAAAALRADRRLVQRTGRWLVRHSTDRCSATVGLALLATDSAEEDIPAIQTIGLLSKRFGPLAAEALRRRSGGAEALLWLAQRVTGWGRVEVIEALCRTGGHSCREWLLRHACDGDVLNGYFAGKVATAAHLHEAITGTDVADDVIDHTGRLLRIMLDCGGIGMTLEHYPPAPVVLAAHATLIARQAPTVARYVDAAVIAAQLAIKAPPRCGCTTEQRDRIVRQYRAVLDRQHWCDTARAGLNPTSDLFAWFTGSVAARLDLRAFADLRGGEDR